LMGKTQERIENIYAGFAVALCIFINRLEVAGVL